MKYPLLSAVLLSSACGGGAMPGGRDATSANDGPRAPKNPAKFDALPLLPAEGPSAERPARMLKAMQAKGYSVALQKDKSVLFSTEKFGLVIPTATAHLCQFDLHFLTGKGAADESALVNMITGTTKFGYGTNVTFQPEGSKFRVTARRAAVVQNENECADVAERFVVALTDTVEALGDVYGAPVYPGVAAPSVPDAMGTSIQLGNSAAGGRIARERGAQGYLDYYYGMLDSEGADPTVDEDGDIRFHHEGNTLFVPVPSRVSQVNEFAVVSQSHDDAVKLPLPLLRAACVDAMKGSVFVRCTAFQNDKRVALVFTADAHVGRAADPRYNFRNMASAVHQTEMRAVKYVFNHK